DATQLNWQRVATGFARLGEDASGDRQPGVPAASSEAAGQASTGKAQADQAPTDQAPADQAQAAPPQAAPEPSRNTWQITLGAFRLEAGAVLLRDEPSGLDYPIDGLSAEVDQIAWPPTPDQPMQARLSMDNSLDGGTLRAQAPIVLQPLAVHAQVALDNLALAPFAAAVRHYAPIALKDGRLSLEGMIDAADGKVQGRDIKLGLRQFAARDESVKPGVDLSLESLALTADRLALDAEPARFTLR